MLKKGNPTKVLKQLADGFVIRESRIIDSKTGKVSSSKIGLFKGKKVVNDGFKNTKEAEEFYNEEVAKR